MSTVTTPTTPTTGSPQPERSYVQVTTATATEEEARRLAGHIRAEHSYETPEITATPISLGSADYLAWIDQEATGDGG